MVDDKVYLKDVSNAGYCMRGARAWFRSHGLDFRDFVRNGVSREVFMGTKCHLAQDIVKKKDERENG